MKPKKRRFLPGAEPKEIISLRAFLPYRFHALSSLLAMPPPFELPSGKVVRARDWRVILQLAAHGPRTNRELAELLGLDTATITRIVQYLSEQGLVATRVSSTDRRKQFVGLTPDGAAAHDLIAPGRKDVNRAVSAGFTSAELELLLDLIDKFEAHLLNQRPETDHGEWI